MLYLITKEAEIPPKLSDHILNLALIKYIIWVL